MPETEYTVFAETVTADGGPHTVYGIRCVREGRVVACASDITADLAKIEKTALLCSRLRLDPLQLKDIAEDTAPEEL